MHFDRPLDAKLMMNLDLPTAKLKEMQDSWNDVGQDAIYMSHYELAEQTPYQPNEWREFLTTPEIADWINQEIQLVQQAKMRLLIKDIDSNTKSTGLPQLINTLVAQSEKQNAAKDGPVFIYTYVPPNEQEQGADNVKIAESNPFTVPNPRQ